MPGLKGRVALLAGTDTAAAHAIAGALVGSGARAYLAVPHLDGFGDLVASVGHNHLDAATLDPADTPAVDRAIRACTRRFGRLDIIIAIATMPGETLPGMQAESVAGIPLLVVVPRDAAGAVGPFPETLALPGVIDDAAIVAVIERATKLLGGSSQ